MRFKWNICKRERWIKLDHVYCRALCFVPHAKDEYYVCIQSDRDGVEILLGAIGDIDAKLVFML